MLANGGCKELQQAAIKCSCCFSTRKLCKSTSNISFVFPANLSTKVPKHGSRGRAPGGRWGSAGGHGETKGGDNGRPEGRPMGDLKGDLKNREGEWR